MACVKSSKSVLTLPPFRYRTPKSDRLLDPDPNMATVFFDPVLNAIRVFDSSAALEASTVFLSSKTLNDRGDRHGR